MLSVVKYIKEALVKLFLPHQALGCYANDDKTLIGSLVDIDELAFLWEVVCLPRSLRVALSLVETVCEGHVHLNLDAGQADLIKIISHNQVLVAIMPEERMRLHLDNTLSRISWLLVCRILELLEMVKLDWDDRASFRILNLKLAFE